MKCILFVFFFVVFVGFCSAYLVEPGPSVIATKGEVWPKPYSQIRGNGYMILRPEIFKFNVTAKSGKILEDAFERYMKILKAAPLVNKPVVSDTDLLGFLDVLNVNLTTCCKPTDVPNEEMDEEYTLNISMTTEVQATLQANSIWGILRGLETFSQLLYFSDNMAHLMINVTSINDKPQYPHRGLLLDTARHFIPMYIILQNLDAMAYNKMNVFHWHIVDDQSFPYQSKIFPELSEKGAYHPDFGYSHENIKQVIEYAAQRGIRVIVEFDTPGHTRSWGNAFPELLTTCYTGSTPNGFLGPINPIKNETYSFLTKLFKEVVDLFPEKYVHLGGDEVEFECWESNKDIKSWMKKNNLEGSFAGLEDYYIQKVINILKDLNAGSIIWEEVFENKVNIPKDSIVHVWKNNELVTKAIDSGYKTIWSKCWYLDHLSTHLIWEGFYECDMRTKFELSPEKEKLLIGGEACMWGEMIDSSNVISRIWPRASAVAEKLWSPSDLTQDISDAARRLEEHTCRMRSRQIKAQPPNGPGFCLFN